MKWIYFFIIFVINFQLGIAEARVASGGKNCRAAMSRLAYSADTNNKNPAYWNGLRSQAKGICRTCNDPGLCRQLVGSINKKTTVWQIMGMLSQIEHISEKKASHPQDPDVIDYIPEASEVAI